MFTIIGERINTTRKAIMQAVEQRNAVYIQQDVMEQVIAGAAFVDVNAGGRFGYEMEDMRWLLETIQAVVDIPLCLDSPDPRVLEEAYRLVKHPPMINSISLEKERFDALLAFLQGKDCRVIALCMDDTGLPSSADEVVERAGRLLEGLAVVGVQRERVHIDPLIQPVATDETKGCMALDAVRGILHPIRGCTPPAGFPMCPMDCPIGSSSIASS